MSASSIAQTLLDELLTYRRHVRPAPQYPDDLNAIRAVQLPRLEHFIHRQMPIELVLPAFPGKSPNPRKVLGTLPDMAERLSLTFLNTLCQRIKLHYPLGAHLRICSDGHVFADVIQVTDACISAYQTAISGLISDSGLVHLSTFNLGDQPPPGAAPEDFNALRQALIERHAEPLEHVRQRLLQNETGVALYRAMTRFLFEDSLHPTYRGSRTALQNTARVRALLVIQRSWAWGHLLAERFPQAIRLSIHPQAPSSLKLGIHLMPTRDEWLTPWHGIAVKFADDYVLMTRQQAEQLNAVPVLIAGRPSHYETPALGRSAIDAVP